MSDKLNIRAPAMAGLFYPADARRLRLEVDGHLRAAHACHGRPVRALVAPHAGYAYSGPVAGSAFRTLEGRADIRRVVIAGPSHHVAFQGVAVPGWDAFHTPLGNVPVDPVAVAEALRLPGVVRRDDAHEAEHCIEVMLPFLQRVLGDFSILPLVAGDAPPAALDALWRHFCADPATLALVSTDLSHYHAYEVARGLDETTAEAIEGLNPGAIGPEDACGRIPLQGLLMTARSLGWKVRRLDLRNSGDTAGGRDRVVGYGAHALA